MSRARRRTPARDDVVSRRPREPSGPDTGTFRIALARLPGRLRRAIRLFHQLTGLAAVTSIRSAPVIRGEAVQIAPPVHPRCAQALRVAVGRPPCEEEWRRHLKNGLRSPAVQSHVCSLGLSCSCVPIYFGETLVGVAKLVVGPETTARQFSLGVQTLDLTVSRACQDFYVSKLTGELVELRRQVQDLQTVRGAGERAGVDLDAATTRERVPATHGNSMVEKALDYLDAHYLDSELSLTAVSRALGANEKYLTHLFTRVVGQRMRAHIVELRVQHACRQLQTTDGSIKQIAYESGFRQPDRFRRAFHRQVGVAPSTYRRVFAGA